MNFESIVKCPEKYTWLIEQELFNKYLSPYVAKQAFVIILPPCVSVMVAGASVMSSFMLSTESAVSNVHWWFCESTKQKERNIGFKKIFSILLFGQPTHVIGGYKTSNNIALALISINVACANLSRGWPHMSLKFGLRPNVLIDTNHIKYTLFL